MKHSMDRMPKELILEQGKLYGNLEIDGEMLLILINSKKIIAQMNFDLFFWKASNFHTQHEMCVERKVISHVAQVVTWDVSCDNGRINSINSSNPKTLENKLLCSNISFNNNLSPHRIFIPSIRSQDC